MTLYLGCEKDDAQAEFGAARRLTFLPVQIENCGQKAGAEQHGSTGPYRGGLPPKLFSRSQGHHSREQASVESRHKEPHVLHQHRDQTEQQTRPQCHPCNEMHTQFSVKSTVVHIGHKGSSLIALDPAV